MGHFVMPVRGEHDPTADDFVVWSTSLDAPIQRGTREDVTRWWRSIFGEAGVHSLLIANSFLRADTYGSSSSLGDGRWGSTVTVRGYGLLGQAQLDRGKLPAFVAAVFPRDASEAEGNGRGHVEVGREVRALVTPFDPAEDPEIDVEAWKAQAAQAIADFEDFA